MRGKWSTFSNESRYLMNYIVDPMDCFSIFLFYNFQFWFWVKKNLLIWKLNYNIFGRIRCTHLRFTPIDLEKVWYLSYIIAQFCHRRTREVASLLSNWSNHFQNLAWRTYMFCDLRNGCRLCQKKFSFFGVRIILWRSLGNLWLRIKTILIKMNWISKASNLQKKN